MSRACTLPALLLCLGFCLFTGSGCAALVPTTVVDVVPTIAHYGYGTAMDQRSIGDMAYDKDLHLRIKQALMHLRAKDGYFLNIYVYQGRVFLVGDPPDDFEELAVRFAIRQEGVESLDYCFFPHNSGNPLTDFAAACALRTNLIFEPGVSSTWVETEVYAGHAVLLGVVEEPEDVEQIVAVAQDTSGIHRVVNFLLVPGQTYVPPPDSEVNPEI